MPVAVESRSFFSSFVEKERTETSETPRAECVAVSPPLRGSSPDSAVVLVDERVCYLLLFYKPAKL